MIDVSFVIPAYNEADRIEKTLRSLKQLSLKKEIIVVNDGSTDETETIAKKYANTLLTSQTNKGKGTALQSGWVAAKGVYIVCLDADLEESAKEVLALLNPLQEKRADFTISMIQKGKNAGFGLVKKRVQAIVQRETGIKIEAPLSGQRAFHRDWLPVLLERPYHRFGVEMQMTIDLLRGGAKCEEVPTMMTHREMGRTLKGFIHRMKQWYDIERQYRSLQL